VRIRIALTLSALAVGLTACGGGTDSEALSGSVATAPGARQTPIRRIKSDPRKSCSSQGIDREQVLEGACREDGVSYVVANRTSLLRLDSMTVAITGFSASPVVRERKRTIRSRRGAFVRVTLTIKNRETTARRFTYGQTILGIAGNNYPESLVAERTHPEALAKANGGVVTPGGTLRGDVLFDVLPEDIERLPTEGRLFITNFGVRAGTRAALRQLGQFRLYAASQ
jgi:hypothetical protein